MERTDIAKLIKTADEPRGFSSKYWVDDGTKKLIKYNNPTFQDGDVMESLAANVLNCLKVDVVNVHLGYNSDNEFLEKENISSPNCCIVDNFLTKPGDVSISLMGYRIPKVNTGNEQKNISSCFYKVFNMFDSLPNIDEILELFLAIV